MGNPLKRLNRAGQSVWLDNLSRKLVDSGELRRWVSEDAVTGVTSNPTIFQKAIVGSTDYDTRLRKLLNDGIRTEKSLFFGLALDDISDAAHVLRPVYEATAGRDGFVSIEVSPDIAHDTQATVAEAQELYARLNLPNILIKVPATREGIPAIEELIYRGISVNVTLLFSVARYREVTEAYIRGLELRKDEGKPLNGIASVASFFVSRVDTMIDTMLDSHGESARGQMGRAAVANAKIAYRHFMAEFESPRFKALAQKGAGIQRLLWASTGTKNPAYSPVKYIEEIIAPNTVNTLPEPTLHAFKSQGTVRVSIEDGMGEAELHFHALRAMGIEIDTCTEQLECEGIKSFIDSFDSLLKDIALKRDTFLK